MERTGLSECGPWWEGRLWPRSRANVSRVLDLGFGTADRLVSAGADGTARIWNVQHTQSWIEPGQPKAVDFSPDGRYLAAVGADGAVRVTDAATGRLRMSLPGPTGYASALFSPNGNALVIGHDPPSRITIWQLSTNRQSLVAQLPKKRGLNIARFDSTGSRVVYADNAGAIGVRGSSVAAGGQAWRLARRRLGRGLRPRRSACRSGYCDGQGVDLASRSSQHARAGAHRTSR